MIARLLTRRTAGPLLVALMTFELFGGRLGGQSHDTAPIDAVLRQAVERGDIPGVVAMATDRHSTIYSGAFGKAEGASARPMTR